MPRKSDVELGKILDQLNAKYLPPSLTPPGGITTPVPVTRSARDYAELGVVSKNNPRRYGLTTRKNTLAGNPRAGQDITTFVKRADDGNVYRYHQYIENGKRKVFRVGGPMKAP